MKTYKKQGLILLIQLWGFSLLSAQTKSQILKYADEAFQEKNYYTANIYYKQIIDADDKQVDVKYKYAESLRLINDYQLSENYYYQVFEQDQGKNISECLFWLAMMQKQNGKYEQAKKNFEQFAKSYKSEKESYFSKKAKKELESCEFAIKNNHLDTTNTYFIQNINKPVNTIHAEFAPFAFNNKTLFFSSINTKSDTTSLIESTSNSKIKIYATVKENENFQTPVELEDKINETGNDNANFSVSKDQKLAFFSRTMENGLPVIYYTEKDINGKWQNAIKLPEQINYPDYTATQPYFCKFRGENILFFVSDRPGGFGKLDIWSSTVSIENKSEKTNLSFKNPITLGKTINSIDNEITPFYDEFSDSLYFSSDWHLGFGGYDIFKTTGELDSFITAINMGLPINSAANDYYLTVFHENEKNDSKGYLSSNRKGAYTSKAETCCNDIYFIEKRNKNIEPLLDKTDVAINKLVFNKEKTQSSIKLEDPKTATAAKKLNAFLPLSLYFHNDEPNPKTNISSTQLNYKTTYLNYKAILKDYEKEYSKGLDKNKSLEAVADIDHFFNDFVDKGYAELSSFSKTLKDLLLSGHKIELVVKGYASPLAKSDYNVNLSKRRINSFKNYIREFENGVLNPFLTNKSLIIEELPNGEFKAGSMVSDNVNDLKNAIYSRSAALERKIEVNLKQITPPVSADFKKLKEQTPEKLTDTVLIENKIISIPEIEIKELNHDFGTITYGEKVRHKFILKNTGTSDLLIYNAIGSCGCTVPEFSKEAIKPNQEGEINVTFDSKGKFGFNNTSVTVITNGNPKTIKLSIAAEVIIKK